MMWSSILGRLGGVVAALLFGTLVQSARATPPSMAQSSVSVPGQVQRFILILGSRPGFGCELKDGSTVEARLGGVRFSEPQYETEDYRYSHVVGWFYLGVGNEWLWNHGVGFRLDLGVEFLGGANQILRFVWRGGPEWHPTEFITVRF